MRKFFLAIFCILILNPGAMAAKVDVPINVGLGPAIHQFNGMVADDQRWHYGLKLDLSAVISRDTIKKFRHKIPKKYRKMADRVGEFKYSPTVLIPDTIIISPKRDNTGMFGSIWRPLGLGLNFIDRPIKLGIGFGLNLSYIYIYSDVLKSPTHFLRPGLDAKAELEIPFSKSFLISVGWASHFFVPQKLGGSIFSMTPVKEGIWHMGQVYFLMHYRHPITVNF